jgi:tRNA(Arg) A34 adenosine deaminase TadA
MHANEVADSLLKALQHAEYIALQEIIHSGQHSPSDVVLYVTVEPCVMYVIFFLM